jgi:hypothetical protein
MKSGRERWRAAWPVQELARELRKDMTPAEKKLWSKLRKGQICGTHFRKQHPVGPFIIDFFCAKAKLAIEVDGDVQLTMSTICEMGEGKDRGQFRLTELMMTCNVISERNS